MKAYVDRGNLVTIMPLMCFNLSVNPDPPEDSDEFNTIVPLKAQEVPFRNG